MAALAGRSQETLNEQVEGKEAFIRVPVQDLYGFSE